MPVCPPVCHKFQETLSKIMFPGAATHSKKRNNCVKQKRKNKNIVEQKKSKKHGNQVELTSSKHVLLKSMHACSWSVAFLVLFSVYVSCYIIALLYDVLYLFC